MGDGVQWNEKYIGPLLLPLLRWPVSDLAVQNCFFGLAILALRFQWFQRNLRDFEKNPFFKHKRRGARAKRKIIRWPWPKNSFGLCLDAPVFGMIFFLWGPHRENPISPAALGIVALQTGHMRASQPLEPWKQRMTFKTPAVFSRGSFSQCVQKTTLDISKTCCNNSFPRKTLKHCKIRAFSPWTLRAPFWNATRGPFFESKDCKNAPTPPKNNENRCIYVYIYIYAVGRGFGHILAPKKGDLVPGVRPDYPSSGFVLVFWGFRADRAARSNSDFSASLRAKMGRFFRPSELGWGRNSEISFKT